MMSNRIERFEDFVAWQRARKLTAKIYEITDTGRLSKDYGLRDQLRRSAVSIMANIAEGYERGKASEFHPFLSVAKSSCAELRSHLYVAWDVNYLSNEGFEALKSEAEELARIVGGLRASAERRRDGLV
jgi:four helix bundle protein